jgi:PAS domain-containing protein
MKINAYRACWAVRGALVVLIVEGTLQRTHLLGDSLFSFHFVAIVLFTVGAIALLRHAFRSSSEVTLDTNRHTDLNEDATRMLLPLRASMDEGILIVNSELDIVLYNEASTNILRLPVKTRKPIECVADVDNCGEPEYWSRCELLAKGMYVFRFQTRAMLFADYCTPAFLTGDPK